MDSNIARILGGIYIAVTTAMPEAPRQLAHDVLFEFADNPEIRPEDRRIYAMIANAASHEPAESENKNEGPRRRFEIIAGGTA